LGEEVTETVKTFKEIMADYISNYERVREGFRLEESIYRSTLNKPMGFLNIKRMLDKQEAKKELAALLPVIDQLEEETLAYTNMLFTSHLRNTYLNESNLHQFNDLYAKASAGLTDKGLNFKAYDLIETRFKNRLAEQNN
jgi:hypothetical protein